MVACLTDAPTAQLSRAAIDKVRAVLRRPDRDHLDTLESRIQVLGPRDQSSRPLTYQQLVAAMATHRMVQLRYQAAENEAPTTRDIEPLYLIPVPSVARGGLLPAAADYPHLPSRPHPGSGTAPGSIHRAPGLAAALGD